MLVTSVLQNESGINFPMTSSQLTERSKLEISGFKMS